MMCDQVPMTACFIQDAQIGQRRAREPCRVFSIVSKTGAGSVREALITCRISRIAVSRSRKIVISAFTDSGAYVTVISAR